jgi:hypothetical protein
MSSSLSHRLAACHVPTTTPISAFSSTTKASSTTPLHYCSALRSSLLAHPALPSIIFVFSIFTRRRVTYDGGINSTSLPSDPSSLLLCLLSTKSLEERSTSAQYQIFGKTRSYILDPTQSQKRGTKTAMNYGHGGYGGYGGYGAGGYGGGYAESMYGDDMYGGSFYGGAGGASRGWSQGRRRRGGDRRVRGR